MTTDETKTSDESAQEPQSARDPSGGGASAGPGRHLARVLTGRSVMVRQVDLAKVRLGSGVKALQSSAGPAAARTTALVKRRTSEVAVWLQGFNKQTAAPRFSRFFKRLRRRLHPASIIRDYRGLLLLTHSVFIGRDRESLFFVPTRGHIRLVRLSVPSQLRGTAHDYRPTPYKVFEWAMAALPDDNELGDTTFVDFGAGRGRVLMMASQRPFETITGAEIARELHDDCLMNIAQYPRSLMKCRNVECLHTRATTLPIPEGPAVFYFFNPFEGSIFEKVLARIVRSYKRSRREMHLICIDMQEAASVEAQGVFRKVTPPFRQRLKIALFSPYTIGVYRTDP